MESPSPQITPSYARTTYRDYADSNFNTQLLRGCQSAILRRRPIQDELTVSQILSTARASELADQQAVLMELSRMSTPSQVNCAGPNRGPSHPQRQQQRMSFGSSGLRPGTVLFFPYTSVYKCLDFTALNEFSLSSPTKKTLLDATRTNHVLQAVKKFYHPDSD